MVPVIVVNLDAVDSSRRERNDDRSPRIISAIAMRVVVSRKKRIPLCHSDSLAAVRQAYRCAFAASRCDC